MYGARLGRVFGSPIGVGDDLEVGDDNCVVGDDKDVDLDSRSESGMTMVG